MTLGEYFVKRWEAEQRAFRNVRAVEPGDKLDYRPHERSTSAGDLARQLAVEQHDLLELLDKQETTYVPTPHGRSRRFSPAWDKATDELRAKLNAPRCIRGSGEPSHPPAQSGGTPRSRSVRTVNRALSDLQSLATLMLSSEIPMA